jgi:hypothetical protein
MNGSGVPEPDPAIFENGKVVGSLKRIQIEGMQDLTLHKIGGKQLFQTFLDAFPIPANSDYYPFLDQNAARARFLQKDAIELIKLMYRPLPVSDVLMKSRSADQTRITSSPDFARAYGAFAAMALRDYYLGDGFSNMYHSVSEDVKREAIRLRQLFFTDCAAGAGDRINGLYAAMAVHAIPFLNPDELDAVWKKLESGACVPLFTPRDRQWIAFLKAAGKRDTRTMADSARALLEKEQDLPEGPMRYLLAAGMLGYLDQGEKENSLNLWQKYGSRLGAGQQELLFRFLVALSSPG